MPSPLRAFLIGVGLAAVVALALGSSRSLASAVKPSLPKSCLRPDPEGLGPPPLPPGFARA